MATQSCFCVFVLFLFAFQSPIVRANTLPLPPPQCRKLVFATNDLFEFLSQLTQMKTELALQSSVGRGINDISPGLVQAGPAAIGATVANLDNETRSFVHQIGLNGVGHLRAMESVTSLNRPLLRPLVNLTAEAIAGVLNLFGLVPRFNLYSDTLSFLLALNIFTSVIVTYQGAMAPAVIGNAQQALLSRITRTNAAELGAIRRQLYTNVNLTVPPYALTVGELVNMTAEAVNVRGRCGVKEEGLLVPLQLGAENQTSVNVVAGDVNSLGYIRNELEVLRILFGTGNATVAGGVFPAGLPVLIFRLIVIVLRNIA